MRSADSSGQRAQSSGAVLRLEQWLPYRCSFIANIVSLRLAHFYHSKFGLTVAGWRMMAALGCTSPLSAIELARGAAMDPVSVTRAIDQLAVLGMVTRRTDAKDRRRVALRLSERGRAAYEEIVPLAIQLETALVTGFSRTDLDSLDRLLSQIQKNAAKLEGLGTGADLETTRVRLGRGKKGRRRQNLA